MINIYNVPDGRINDFERMHSELQGMFEFDDVYRRFQNEPDFVSIYDSSLLQAYACRPSHAFNKRPGHLMSSDYIFYSMNDGAPLLEILSIIGENSRFVMDSVAGLFKRYSWKTSVEEAWSNWIDVTPSNLKRFPGQRHISIVNPVMLLNDAQFHGYGPLENALDKESKHVSVPA